MQIKLLLFLAMLLAATGAHGQTVTVISPTGDGGFENGPTLGDNGWTYAGSSTVNVWRVGNFTTSAGSRACYIGTSVSDNTGSNSAQITNHIYRDITIPAGVTNVSLTMKLRQTTAESGWDRFAISTMPTSTAPVIGSYTTAYPRPGNPTGVTTKHYENSAAIATYTVVGPLSLTSLAGTTFRLLITFTNSDAFGGVGNPAIDEISLTYDCTAASTPTVSGASTLCTGAGATLSPSATGGTWQSSNSAVASITSGGVMSGVAAGTAIISYTGTNGCRTTRTVTINQSPTVSGTASLCSGGNSVSLSSSLSGGTWSSSNTSVATVNSTTGVVTSAAAGTATITHTATNSCTGTLVATVNATPTAIAGPTTVCPGSTATLTSTPGGGTWTSSIPGNATVNTSGVVSGINPGTTVITYTMPGSCIAVRTTTINAAPNLSNFTAPSAAAVCIGNNNTITVNSTSLGAGTYTVLYSLSGANSGSGSATLTMGASSGTFTVPSASLATAGSTTITITGITNSLSCTSAPAASNTATFNVNANPNTSSFTSPSALPVCAGGTGTATINSSSLGAGTFTVRYNLTGANSSSNNTSSVTMGAASGDFSISGALLSTAGATNVVITRLTNSNGCFTDVATSNTAAFTVNANPDISNFSAPSVSAVCLGGATTATVNSTTLGTGAFTITYDLSGANSSTGNTATLTMGAASGTHTIPTSALSASGSTFYTITAIENAAGCVTNVTSTNTAGFNVNTASEVHTVTGGGSYCTGSAGAAIGLSGSTTGNNYQLYQGSTPVGSAIAGTGSALSFGSFTTVATYTVAATATSSGCTRPMAGSANVFPPFTPSVYTVTGGGSYCTGGTGRTIGLNDSDPGVIYQLFNGSTAVGTTVTGTGEPISLGVHTGAGSYIVVASPGTACATTMSGSATITIDPLPTAFAVTGGGAYCNGSGGSPVGLSFGSSGISYTLYNGSTPVSIVNGTNAALSFGNQTAAGTYSVVATNTSTGCVNGMSGTVSVSVNAQPAAYTISGGGSYCSGGTGLPVNLSGSESTASYQLYKGATTVGTPLAGTGSAITFGNQAAAGAYSVIATSAEGCIRTMTGVVNITVYSTPAVVTVSGGGPYCSGGSSPIIVCHWSYPGINYMLYNGASLVASFSGTGAALSLGSYTAAGTYSVIAVDAVTGCSANMSGTAVVSINSAPTVFNVGGTGGYCAGGSGVAVTLSGSQTGATYQVYRAGSPVGAPVAGTGSALSLGTFTEPGNYTVAATLIATGCTATMTCSATITINALPTVYSVTGGGSYCAGGTGVPVGLSGSQTDVRYFLYNGATLVGSATGTVGTGLPMSLGTQTMVGTYTVFAQNTSTGCTNTMSGTATIATNPLPAAFAVTGGGGYCSGGPGAPIGLSSSAAGVTYNLMQGSTPVATAAGTGGAITFGTFTTAGTYTATATGSGCSANMTGSATVSVTALPTVYNVTGGGAYCAGGSGVAVGLSSSATSTTYTLYNGSTAVATAAGTGSAISFGPQTAAGTYTVSAGSTSSGCSNNMSGAATVTINSLPTAFSVIGGGSYCAGSTGIAVGLNGSQTGVNYYLYNGATPVGGSVAGTGLPLSLGVQTLTGTYTVFAQNPTTTCSNPMSGNTTISVNPLPTAFAVTGGGGYCTGGTGVTIGLASSTVGVTYTLHLGAAAVAVMNGTGSALSFGTFTTPGTYTATAGNISTTCTANMTGSATVSINPLPAATSVTGGGQYCAGGTGVAVGISSSATDATYTLYLGSTAIATIAGTGSAISFGAQTAAGVYTVSATNANGCSNNMTGNATVVINAAPTLYNVTGGGNYCDGGSGVPVGLSGSQPGIVYQLYNGATPVPGALLAGTGTPLSFGNITVAGTYTVRATNSGTLCENNMLGSVTIGIDALPSVHVVSGGGQYCAGGAGMAIMLDNSQTGVNYRLYNGSSLVATVAGTGAALDMGMRTAAGTYSVLAVSAASGCTANMSGSATITVNATPAVYTVSGGGQYCAGGAGVNVTLSGSTAGIYYQLYNGTLAAGLAIPGTGASLILGPVTAAGTYNVVALNATTGCEAAMTGAATVTVNSLPTAYNVTGGGQYCAGGAGISIGLSGSNVGVSYQLFNGSTPSGSAIPGTGLTLDFGVKTAGGSYTVIAVNNTTGCTNNMTGSAMITVNANPTVYTVTGGGQYCAGGAGVAIGLAGSNAGISYQLYNGATPVGSTVAGTGAPITFGMQTAAGTYTVAASNAGTSCAANMSGAATVSINALPTVYSMTGGGNYCAGGTGVMVGLNSSNIGITYQLHNGSGAVGSPQAGTGGAVNFGLQTTAGAYYVVATNSTTSCTNNMAGVANVVANELPTVYSMTGGGTYCSGSGGLAVGLAGSNTGISYQLYNGAAPVGTAVAGTGAALSFGILTAAGNYGVIATNIATSCTSSMAGTATIVNNPSPAAFAVTGGGSYCTGGAGVAVGLSGSATGVAYQLYNGSSMVGGPVAGTGSALSFGMQSAAGTYSVLATNTATSCAGNMSGTATVTVNSQPNVYNVVSMGTGYCAGGTGVNIMLSGSQTGVSYQLYNGSLAAGAPVAGTGAMLSFGPQTAAGVYMVVATSGSSCTANMNGAAPVTVNPAPVAQTVTGNGGYCAGSAGSVISLASTTAGTSYQLYRGTTAVGSAVAGTGSSISFAPQTTAGTYMVMATITATGCQGAMTGTINVSVNPVPAVQTVTGGGQYCSGGTGVAVGLAGSAAGVNYTLYNGSSAVATVAGSGSAVSFGMQTAAGTYSVMASNAATACTSNMSGAATVVVNALPAAQVVTGGGNYCAGSATGMSVGLAGSATGVTYQLYNGTAAVPGTLAGTGAALDFGMQSASGTYTVRAVDAATLCAATMSGSAVINANAAPAAYTVTGGGSYCIGGTGVHVGLDGSQAGISYRLYNGTAAVGSPMTGTGSALDFGMLTGAGTYTVMATNTATSCAANMNGSASVAINTTVTPSVTINTGVGDTVCHGVLTTFSAVPVNGGTTPTYQWQVNGVNVGFGSGTYSYLPAHGDIVSVQMTSSSSCATPAMAMATKSMSVLVSQLPVANVSVTADRTCMGTPVTFSVSPMYGGPAPSYTWMKNGVSVSTGATSYTYTPTDGDNVYVKMTSNYRCRLADEVNSTTTTMSVDTPQTPIVVLAATPGTSIAKGQTVTITATVTKAGNAPQYQWYINSTPVTGATSNVFTSNTIANNDSVTCLVTNISACAPMAGYSSVVMKVEGVGVQTVAATIDVQLVPNPNKGDFTVRGTMGTEDRELVAEVTDMLGQVIYRGNVQARGGNISERINLGNTLANGMYMLSLRTATESKVFHFVIGQ